MKTLVKRFVKDASGATAIDYGILPPGLQFRSSQSCRGVGTNLNTTFASVQTALK